MSKVETINVYCIYPTTFRILQINCVNTFLSNCLDQYERYLMLETGFLLWIRAQHLLM